MFWGEIFLLGLYVFLFVLLYVIVYGWYGVVKGGVCDLYDMVFVIMGFIIMGDFLFVFDILVFWFCLWIDFFCFGGLGVVLIRLVFGVFW